MEVAVGLVLAVFIFGALLLMMFFGYQRIEQERATSANEHAAEQWLGGPRFFAHLEPTTPRVAVPDVPPQLLEQLEQRLRSEYRNATLFASQPTMEGICPDYSAYVDAVGRELERHIQRECAATAAFVSEPTVERLCGNSGTPIGLLLRRQKVGSESGHSARAHQAAS